MTPSEKARQMVDTFALATAGADHAERISNAKGIALLAVAEIIDAIHWHKYETPPDDIFWHAVQIEIMAL